MFDMCTSETILVRSLTSSSRCDSSSRPSSVSGIQRKRRAGALAQHLPRHQVGVVLHLGTHTSSPGRSRSGCRGGVAEE
jgi:hypothetical protein